MRNKEFTSIKYVGNYIEIAQALKINLGLVGAHGRAKTSYIKQYAESHGYKLITLILSRMTPEDMIGLPTETSVNGISATGFSSPDWLIKASDPNEKVMLFFDEFNNAELDTMASILDLIESREANGLTLADTTQIVCAFNPISIAPNGKTLSKATRDRFCLIPICDKSSEKEYLNYFAMNGKEALVKTISGFVDPIVQNYDDEIISTVDKNAEPTWRSLEKSYNICKYVVDNNLDDRIATTMVSGYIGTSIGNSVASSLLCNIKDNIKKSANKNDLYTVIRDAYENGGYVNMTKVVVSQNLLGDTYDECALCMNVIRTIVSEPEFYKALNSLTTKEFISKFEEDFKK